MRLGSLFVFYTIATSLGLDLDSRWESICQRLFPNCVMINGSLASLPVVDILLLSRTSLNSCGIKIFIAPFSLLLTSTGNVPVNSDRKRMRWSTPTLNWVVGPWVFIFYFHYIEIVIIYHLLCCHCLIYKQEIFTELLTENLVVVALLPAHWT